MDESEINKLINSMTKKFENGGFIDCLRNGGSVEKCKCGCDKIAKAEDGKKVRRTDMPGYAYTLSDGTDVLTQDAVGIQPLPGSNYSIAGSSPEYETQRTTLTDEGGNIVGYNYNIYVNDGDHFGPINRYTTKRMLEKPSTWFRTVLQENPAKSMKEAYDANKLDEGGVISAAKGLSRKETLDILKDDGGFGQATARTAYQQARQRLRQQTPLRGKDLRYQARKNAIREILNEKALSQLPVLDDFSNIEIKDEFPTVEVSSIAVDTTKPIIETLRVPTDTNVYTTAMSRQDAFADARKRGFKTYI